MKDLSLLFFSNYPSSFGLYSLLKSIDLAKAVEKDGTPADNNNKTKKKQPKQQVLDSLKDLLSPLLESKADFTGKSNGNNNKKTPFSTTAHLTKDKKQKIV